MRALAILASVLGLAALTPLACQPSSSETLPTLSREELLDPAACKSCHEDHFREWSGSMHAYAADDPVFLAMNARGQRETGGALGGFCVGCHAPMAVRTGATKDGLNLAEVPQKLKGVTCFFCHTVDGVEGTHNNPLHLSDEPVMLGGFDAPVANTAHRARYSALHDREKAESAKLCGACHDVTTPKGAPIERTFAEWQASVFSHAGGATCGQCHMDQSATLRPIASAPGVFARRFHGHAFPAVDVAVTPGFPEAEAQKQKVQALLDTTLQSALCVTQAGGLRVLLDNVAAGHSWPSGAAQDRRAWTEVIAYKGSRVIFESGVVPDGGVVEGAKDPNLWLLRDCMFDERSKPVSMFWEAAAYTSSLLPGQSTFDPLDKRFYQTHVVQTFPRGATTTLPEIPDRVTLRVRLQPIGADVLDELIASGDLEPTVKAAMPTFDVGRGGVLEWTPETATSSYFEERIPVTCVTKSNFDVAADKVPAPNGATCVPPIAPPPPDAGPGGDAATITCQNDARADAYAANLEKPGRAGTLRFVLVEASPAPPVRETNTWTVKVLDAAGNPVRDAKVTATPFMPDHGHGTSIVPDVTAHGDGTYTITPIYLFMPGLWRVTVTAATSATTDSAIFVFCVAG